MRETSEDDENIPLFELKKRLRNQNRSTDSSESDQEMEINATSSRCCVNVLTGCKFSHLFEQ